MGVTGSGYPSLQLQSTHGGETMKVNWITDADAALAEAKSSKKPLLVDFSAAPA